ncbi:MAG: hypothetical protein JWO67_1325 [Streptosporangiaceae bacterium]|nr:hypothetical protein [Streptosporangiaceae bacterium]
MAGKAHTSNAPGAQIRDASGDLASHVGHGGGRVTTPQAGVGQPPKAVAGTKLAHTRTDMRDNDGDEGAAGMGPSSSAMRGVAGSC